MTLLQQARNLARKTVDGFYSSNDPKIQLVGDEDSGWSLHTDPWPAIAYCAGVGGGISFEQAIARKTPRPVLVFDPSPTGIATMQKTDQTNILYYQVGFAAQDGIVEFSPPEDPGEGSFSVAKEGMEKISFECWSLPTIMQKHDDHAIDLLKMDIEGFEFDILDAIVRDSIPVRQICVEIHPWLAPNRTDPTIVALKRAGYKLIHKRRGDHTFLLAEDLYQTRKSTYTPAI